MNDATRLGPVKTYIRRSAKGGDYKGAKNTTELAAQLRSNISNIKQGDGGDIRHAEQQVRYFATSGAIGPRDQDLLLYKLGQKYGIGGQNETQAQQV